jgi:hypothetical protein
MEVCVNPAPGIRMGIAQPETAAVCLFPRNDVPDSLPFFHGYLLLVSIKSIESGNGMGNPGKKVKKNKQDQMSSGIPVKGVGIFLKMARIAGCMSEFYHVVVWIFPPKSGVKPYKNPHVFRKNLINESHSILVAMPQPKREEDFYRV